ncbi:MAG: DUF3343 domain-containing protein [Firmicutes bacterium]|nr:DUF3343 domain-containing protein [Bacillota bacterium]
MEKEYIIAFSSFYKAAYAEDLLGEAGINSTLRKLPMEIARSCSTGVYLKGVSIERVKTVLAERGLQNRGIYMISKDRNGKASYTLVH